MNQGLPANRQAQLFLGEGEEKYELEFAVLRPPDEETQSRVQRNVTSPTIPHQVTQKNVNYENVDYKDDVNIQILRSSGGQNYTKTKRGMVEIENANRNSREIQQMQQKTVLAELDQIMVPISQSLDHMGSRFGCASCDPRMSHLMKVPISSNLDLAKNVVFIPPSPFSEGHFQYTLLFSGLVDALPAERMRADAHHRTKKLINRINVYNAAAAKLASIKLQSLYSRQSVSFATKYDLGQRHFLLPVHCVVRPSSNSHEVRVCETPNTMYDTDYGQVSFNKALQPISSTQPKFYRFLLQHILNIEFSVCDISQQFNRVRYSYESSLCYMTLAMKSRRGLPTYVLDDCFDDTLYAIRHLVLGFGGSQSPATASYCLKEAVKTYRKFHPKTTDKDDFLIKLCEETIMQNAWADDIFVDLSLKSVLEWGKIQDQPFKIWPLDEYKCTTGQYCSGNHQIFTMEEMEMAWKELSRVAKVLMVQLCQRLTDILQFVGFRLKHFQVSNDPTLQARLDKIICNQTIGKDDPTFIEVVKPTKGELHDQMKFLSPQCRDLAETPSEVNPQVGTQHLGVLYVGREVSLVKKTISFVYSLDQKRYRSCEFSSFEEFHCWHKRTKPTFTRRSLFSLLSVNQDCNGRHLGLYRARMKILIRTFLKKHPVAGWEQQLSTEIVKVLFHNIELYFHLVHLSIFEPKIAKYSTTRQILAASDGSSELYCISITAIFSTCLAGNVVRQATHLALLPYSVHLQMINIVQIELTGFLKLLCELRGYLQELSSIGCEINPENILVATDSMTVVRLLRCRLNILQKRSSHQVSKAVLQLHTMKLNPFFSVAWADQKTANFFPDLYSKVPENETIAQALNTRKKLFQMGWVTSGPVKALPGIHFDLPKPEKDEINELRQSHVINSEWKNFQSCFEKESSDPPTQVSAATKILANCRRTGFVCDCCNCKQILLENDSQISKFENLGLENISTPESNIGIFGRKNTTCKLNSHFPGRQTLRSSATVTSAQDHDHDDMDFPDITNGENSVIHDENDKVEVYDHDDVDFPDITNGDNSVIHDDHNVEFPDIKIGHHSVIHDDDWKQRLNRLIDRKLSMGLNHKSALAILTICLKFGLKLKTLARKGSPGRAERQKERQTNRQTDKSVFTFNHSKEIEGKRDMRDRHQWFVIPANLFYRNFGDLDNHILTDEPSDPQDRLKGGARQRKLDEMDEELQSQVFHCLTHLFSSEEPVKNYKNTKTKDKYGNNICLLIGRKQRNIFVEDQPIQAVRLRPIQPDCSFEKLLLTAAHTSHPNNLQRASISLWLQNIHILKQTEKLRAMQGVCPACCLLRGAIGRADDKIKHIEPGPTSQLYRALGWARNKSYHQCDLAGPCTVFLNNPDDCKSMYILLCLQLPLKRLTCIPIFDYSSESLYLGLLTYATAIGGNLDIMAMDAGSQMGVFQQSGLGFQNALKAGRLPKQAGQWSDLVLGKRADELKSSGVFLKVVSGQHKSLNQIESCVSILKNTLAALDKKLTSTLSFFEWDYVLKICQKSVMTRPIAASAEGRVWTPQCLLNLMAEAAGQEKIQFAPQPLARSEEVIQNLQRFEKRMFQIRTDVAMILIDSLIKPSFFHKIVREEKIKRRAKSDQILPGDICFCPKLYKSTLHITRSLLQVMYVGEGRQSAVCRKTGKWSKNSVVTRDFSDLFFVTKGTRDVIFDNQWTPTFQLKQVLSEGHFSETNLTFGSCPDKSEVEECLRKNSASEEQKYEELMGVTLGGGNYFQDEPELAEEGGLHQEDQGEGNIAQQVPKYSRFGRKIIRPSRFQS